jgi:uncharacterized membrane protein
LIHLTWQAKFLKIEDYASYFIYIQHFIFQILGILPYLFTQYVLFKIFKRWYVRAGVLFIMPVLMAVGIMLGREFRFNSWDIFLDAGSVLVSMSQIAYDFEIRQGFFAFWILSQTLSIIAFLTFLFKARVSKWFSVPEIK